MSYHIYTTPALVLRERPRREADRVYSLFTRDLGLIRASAGGVRNENSKLRASLEPLSFSKVSLVKGKEYWKITSASLVKSLPHELEKDVLTSLVKVFSLLEKLVAGEEKHEELYDVIEKIAEIATEISPENVEELEIILAARLLWHLGYISKEDVPIRILEDISPQELFETVRDHKKAIVKAINEGIQISGLTE